GEAVAAQRDHEGSGERIDAEQANARLVCDELVPLTWLALRRPGEREVLGAVVVQDQEATIAVRVMLDVVLDALPAGRDQHRVRLRTRGIDDPDLAGHLAVRINDHVSVRPAEPDADPEPFVGLLVDEYVSPATVPLAVVSPATVPLATLRLGAVLLTAVRAAAAEPVPPHAVRAPGIVNGEVEHRGVVGRPRRTVEDVRDLVRQHLAGAKVLEPQREALVAGEVDRVREQVAVRAHVEGAEREVRRGAGLDVAVEQHLLAREWCTVACGRRGDLASLHPAAAVDPVLLPFDGAGVVPVPVLAYGYREVRLLGPRLDLVEDRLAQALLVLRPLPRVGVLGLEVRDGVRVVGVGEPGELVDHPVA